MGDIGKSNQIAPPVYLLLPICVELETDMFFHILKTIVDRKRVDDNDQLKLFKKGMTAEKLLIEPDDISKNCWKDQQLKSNKERQFKLLGFWTIQNFPLFGKNLFGRSWQAPERKWVGFSENAPAIKPEKIDTAVFQKMKLRIIELCVSDSTLNKLKYFVRVPNSIGKYRELYISPKMKSFEIQEKYLDICWKALKLGLMDVNFEVIFINDFKVTREYFN